MRNYEILERIYEKCPDLHTEDRDFDDLSDILFGIRQLIHKERPAISKGKKEFTARGKQRHQ
jgi:hypothetical protein